MYSREWRLTAPNSVLFNSAIRAPKFHHTRDYTRTIRGDPENKVSASFALNLQAFCIVQACSGSESCAPIARCLSPDDPAPQSPATHRHPEWPSGQIWPNPSK